MSTLEEWNALSKECIELERQNRELVEADSMLAEAVLEYVGPYEIDPMLDADIALQKLARAALEKCK